MIRKCSEEISRSRGKIDEAFQGLSGIKDGLIERARNTIAKLENEIARLEGIRKLIETAREFYRNASDKIRRELEDGRSWREYPQMAYYKKMKGMF